MLRRHLRPEVLRRLPDPLRLPVHGPVRRQVLHRLRTPTLNLTQQQLPGSDSFLMPLQDNEGYRTPDPDTIDSKCGMGYVRQQYDSGVMVMER